MSSNGISTESASFFTSHTAISGISGHTRLVGVFGYPVTHSLSPAMHNAAFAALALPFVYVPFSVAPDGLGLALRSLPALGIVGVNLTIPHKESALPFMDSITEEARVIGAVNTVHCVEGRLCGDNTDGHGFYRPLREAGVSVAGQIVVVLGAGGAARAVIHRLVHEGATVVLANRTRERAERLAHDILQNLPQDVGNGSETSKLQKAAAIQVITWDETPASKHQMAEALRAARVLVNTTRIGMVPEQDTWPDLPLESFSPTLLVYDLVYNPVETKLLQEARRRGCETLTGVKMLVYQGAAALERWVGVWPPTDIMEQAVILGLKTVR